MTTSNSTDFEVTRDQIIRGALRLVGGLAQGETPTPDQYTEAAEALNLLVKAWMADGLHLWAMKEQAVPLTALVNSYNIGLGQTVNVAKPIRVVQAYLRTTGNVDIPMRIITRDEYTRLGNKVSSGRPIQIWYEPLNGYGVIHVFPTPTSADVTSSTLYIVYQRPFEDFDASADTPDFPQEWQEALKYGLAVRLATEYGVPPNDRTLLIKEAKEIKELAMGNDVEEGSLFFQVDYRYHGWPR
jgi:hypothetical protein